MEYDPNRSPVPEQWLKLDETERIGLVIEDHARSDADLPNPVLHATFHAVVENQLAESISEVRTTFDRLMSEGLDRLGSHGSITRNSSSRCLSLGLSSTTVAVT